eukprot:9490720-Pyramimonas_sp.AAC.1
MGCGASQPVPSFATVSHRWSQPETVVPAVTKTVDDFVPYDDPRANSMKHYFRGNSLMERGEYDLAIEEFTSAVHVLPDFAP